MAVPSFDLGDFDVPVRPRRRRGMLDDEPGLDSPPLSDADASIIVDDVTDDILGRQPEPASPPPREMPADVLGLDRNARPAPILTPLMRAEAEQRAAAIPVAPLVVDDDEEPDLGGPIVDDTRPSSARVADVNAPGQRAKRLGAAPEVREILAEEKTALEDAGRRDRRRNIARGVTGGLGLLTQLIGAGSGNFGLSALGEATAGASSVAPSQRDQAQAQIDRRVAGERSALDRHNAEQEALAAATRAERAEGREIARDELNARRGESDLALDQARIAQLAAEQAESDFEREALVGNAAGMRSAIRARIAAVQHGATREALQAGIGREGSDLDRMNDLPSLQRILAEVADTDVRRGGQGAGGSGGGGRSETVYNPTTGAYETRTTRSRPTGGAPSSGSPAAPRGSSAGVPAMAGPAPTGEGVSTDNEVQWAERVMRDAGWTDRDRREGMVRRLRTGSGNAAHDTAMAELQVLAGRTERMREGGMPPEAVDIDPAEWDRMNTFARNEMTPFVEQRRRALDLLARARGWIRTRPIALRAAMETVRNPDAASNFSPDVLAQAQDISSVITRYTNPMLSARSGAAVTASEMQRFLTELANGSSVGNLSSFEAAINSQVDDWEGKIADRAADLNPIFVRHWGRQHGFGGGG